MYVFFYLIGLNRYRYVMCVFRKKVKPHPAEFMFEILMSSCVYHLRSVEMCRKIYLFIIHDSFSFF